MSDDKKPGDPAAVRHLRPDTMPASGSTIIVGGFIEDDIIEDGEDDAEWLARLQSLRDPFPEHMIEKLPKPLYKGAWDGASKGKCDACGGYHVLYNTIHLDYVGHANTTNRLLEADLLWTWEPMAYTEHGTPLFSDGGLWIRLTICGVTRIGFGDGGSVKEVIGDAIRNAAMRFGVALDLWSKIDLHSERNPGDGATQSRRDDAGDQVHGPRGAGRDQVRTSKADGAVAAASAPNQEALDSLASVCEALDSLASVCNEYGYDQRSMRALYAAWRDNPNTPLYAPDPGPTLTEAHPDNILAFAAHLIEAATAELDEGTTPGAVADTAETGADTVVDTSDVEKKPEEPF